MTIWYVYEKSTGLFAGSGITYISDEIYESTTTEPPEEPTPPSLIYNHQTDTWSWIESQ